MEVRPGYKQTEIGVIPEEWKVRPLGSVLLKGTLGGNYTNRDEETEFPLMKMGNIARGHFDLTKGTYPNICVKGFGADLSTAAGVACDERPTRWASRVHVTPAG